MLTREKILEAAFHAFLKLDRCGSLDSAVQAEMCDFLSCDPAELTKALDANDDELRIEIACM